MIRTSTSLQLLDTHSSSTKMQSLKFLVFLVLGDGAGEGALNTCTPLARQFVENPSAPEVKVCGTGIKATFYLMNRCKEYAYHQKQVGKCDTGAPPSTCDSWSPDEDPRFGHYQSYLVEQCS